METALSPREGILHLVAKLVAEGSIVNSKSWQGVESPDNTLELTFEQLKICLPNTLKILGQNIKPNQPWADTHLQERLGGRPLNPGKSYEIWPWYSGFGKKNDKFREREKFSHTYMERFWPKKAGSVIIQGLEYENTLIHSHENHMGIRYPYGDLDDVINLLVRDPKTRQAYLPIFFPEDTGGAPGRVPCTLGYTFLFRGGRLHISYHMRSCDALRHFQDDIYLAGGLLYYVLGELGKRDPNWHTIFPGNLIMSIDSFHIFEQDLPALKYMHHKLLNQRT